MNAETPAAKKRGRKPIGEHAMSPAEAKRRSRERKASEGSVEFMIRLQGGTLAFIDLFATTNNVSRSSVIEAFLDMAISRVGIAVSEATDLRATGATDEQVASCLHRALQTTPEPHLIETYKEVMGLK